MKLQIMIMTEEPPVPGFKVLRGHSVRNIGECDENMEIVLRKAGITFRYRMIAHESGGATEDQGLASIICDNSGRRMKYYTRPDQEDHSNGIHAVFILNGPFIRISVQQKGGNFSAKIEKYRIESGRIGTMRLWEHAGGNYIEMSSALPDPLSHFGDALRAAMNKAMCYHCREPHYVCDGEEKT